MEFLVTFDITIPEDAPDDEVLRREQAEAAAAADLASQGQLERLWKAPGEGKAVGVYRADSEPELDGLMRALPMYDWMQVTITPLQSHPNDPATPSANGDRP